MNILYLIIIIAGVAGQNITKKIYTKKTGAGGTYLFSSLTALFSMMFFLVTSKNISWNPGLVPYSIAFALSFATSSLFGLLAVANGPLSLSSLMISYSLMIPTFYGIIFLKEPMSICFVIGLGLLAIYLFLVNKKMKSALLHQNGCYLFFFRLPAMVFVQPFRKYNKLNSMVNTKTNL